MELLVVLFILGVLVAVVTISVVGLFGRGEEESYAVDERTIQLASSTFFSDSHAYDGRDPGGRGWNEAGNGTSVHNYATADGAVSGLYPGAVVEMGRFDVEELLGPTGDPATAQEVGQAAIWMSLLTNGPGEGSSGADVAPGDTNSPLKGEHGPYLNPLPESCSHLNSSTGKGSYTWIVGAYGRVYGAFEEDGVWYVGFGGRYP